jgi:formylmethanofuran dehydrogenase subunit E
MYYTDNPVADFDRYDREETKRLSRLPVCAECGEPIQDEICYEINGEFICPECLDDNHKRWTEDVL